jgi:oligoribonuclease NrnB/cAMP/cGMP phosphodiesterase (DHH superfamily)
MKIVCISHSDLDGVVSALLVKEYASQRNIPFEVYKARYDNIDAIFNQRYSKDIMMFITDISLKTEPDWIGDVNNIILIDHHTGSENSKIKKKVVDIAEGTSGCKLVFDYLNKSQAGEVPFFNDKFRQLMELGHDYDSWTHKTIASKALNYLYYFYKFERFYDRFKYGFDEFTKDELCFLKCKNAEIKNILTNMEFSVINDDVAFIIVDDNVNEVAEELYKNRGFMYVFMYSPKRKVLSLRSRKDAVIHCGEFLRMFGGGGHRCSGGVSANDVKINEVLNGFEVVYDEYHPVF